jgi:hypothetical protein
VIEKKIEYLSSEHIFKKVPYFGSVLNANRAKLIIFTPRFVIKRIISFRRSGF